MQARLWLLFAIIIIFGSQVAIRRLPSTTSSYPTRLHKQNPRTRHRRAAWTTQLWIVILGALGEGLFPRRRVRSRPTRLRGALGVGLFSREQRVRTQQRRAFGGATRRRRNCQPRPWRLPSALGVGLFLREQRLRSQQRRAFWDLRGGVGTAAKALAAPERARRGRVLAGAVLAHAAAARVWRSTRRRRHRLPRSWRLLSAVLSMLACFRGSSACTLLQRRAFGELRVGGGTESQCLGGSRARSVRACSHGSNTYARCSGARLGSYTLAAPAVEASAAPERARRELVLTGAMPVRATAARFCSGARLGSYASAAAPSGDGG